MKIKKIIKGSIIEIVPTIIIALIEIIKMNLFIKYMGSATNGYYQFINQIIAYLFLVEAGLNSAIIYKMYKPVAKKDIDKINSIYSGSIIIFKKISLIMTIIMILMMAIFPFVVKSGPKDLMIVLISFILIGFANIISFVMFSKSLTSVFYANEDKYIPATITSIIKIITSTLTIFLIIYTKSLILIALTIFISKIIEEFIVLIIAKRKYPYLKKVSEKDTSAMKMTKDLIWHQIGSLTTNNVDTVVLMLTSGPVIVSIYSTYNYIFKFLTELITKFTSTVSNTLGIIFNTKTEEEIYESYNNYLYVCFLIAIIISLSFLIGVRSFIGIWIGDTNYILSFITIFLFSSVLFIRIIYSPIVSATNVKGLFKETKYNAIVASLINFILSIILVIKFGIPGVLFATAVSTFISIILRINVVTKLIFPKIKNITMILDYMKKYIIFILLALIISKLEHTFITNINNYLKWFIYMSLFTCIILFIVTIYGYITNNFIKQKINHFIFRKKQI